MSLFNVSGVVSKQPLIYYGLRITFLLAKATQQLIVSQVTNLLNIVESLFFRHSLTRGIRYTLSIDCGGVLAHMFSRQQKCSLFTVANSNEIIILMSWQHSSQLNEFLLKIGFSLWLDCASLFLGLTSGSQVIMQRKVLRKKSQILVSWGVGRVGNRQVGRQLIFLLVLLVCRIEKMKLREVSRRAKFLFWIARPKKQDAFSRFAQLLTLTALFYKSSQNQSRKQSLQKRQKQESAQDSMCWRVLSERVIVLVSSFMKSHIMISRHLQILSASVLSLKVSKRGLRVFYYSSSIVNIASENSWMLFRVYSVRLWKIARLLSVQTSLGSVRNSIKCIRSSRNFQSLSLTSTGDLWVMTSWSASQWENILARIEDSSLWNQI